MVGCVSKYSPSDHRYTNYIYGIGNEILFFNICSYNAQDSQHWYPIAMTSVFSNAAHKQLAWTLNYITPFVKMHIFVIQLETSKWMAT